MIYEFSWNRSFWSRTRTLNIVRHKFTERWLFKIPTLDRIMLFFVSENALWYDPERIVKVKITEFCSTSDYVGHVWSRNATKPGAELSTIEYSCKTSHWSNDGSQKETNLTLRGKWESVFSGKHMDTVPEETHVVWIMTHKPLGNKGSGHRRKGRSSSPASHSKAKQTDGEGY